MRAVEGIGNFRECHFCGTVELEAGQQGRGASKNGHVDPFLSIVPGRGVGRDSSRWVEEY